MGQLIGIQGGEGSFHEQALQQIQGSTENMVGIQTHPALFDALRSGQVDQAVSAIANNRYGPIMDTVNALMVGDLVITGETYVSVRHQLLGIPGARIEDIKEVHSQAPALGQCGIFLHSGILPDGYERVEQDDTAGSAKMVAEANDPSLAAIASAKAGKLYGLEIIRSDIQDDPVNLTRFVVVERRNGQSNHPDADKTTILLRTGQKPGSLVRALIPFWLRRVNIESLHSSYIPNTQFDMKFLLEFDANEAEGRVQRIYRSLGRQGCDVVTLGSYKNGSNIGINGE